MTTKTPKKPGPDAKTYMRQAEAAYRRWRLLISSKAPTWDELSKTEKNAWTHVVDAAWVQRLSDQIEECHRTSCSPPQPHG